MMIKVGICFSGIEGVIKPTAVERKAHINSLRVAESVMYYQELTHRSFILL